MDKIKKGICTLFVLFSAVPIFAGATHYDVDPNSIFIMASMAIGGGIGIYYFFSTGSKDGFKDKGQYGCGCISFILCIVGVLSLMAMCSD